MKWKKVKEFARAIFFQARSRQKKQRKNAQEIRYQSRVRVVPSEIRSSLIM